MKALVGVKRVLDYTTAKVTLAATITYQIHFKVHLVYYSWLIITYNCTICFLNIFEKMKRLKLNLMDQELIYLVNKLSIPSAKSLLRKLSSLKRKT